MFLQQAHLVLLAIPGLVAHKIGREEIDVRLIKGLLGQRDVVS